MVVRVDFLRMKPVWSLCSDFEVANGFKSLVRKTLQWMMDSCNGIFDGVEEMDIDFCFYVSPF
jgi:hypothetical protein